MTATMPPRWRPAWVGWWVSAGIASAIIGGDFTDAGHTVAVILGVLVSARFRQPIHWTPIRFLMLVASSGFGFLMLAHHWGTMATMPLVGVVGAFVAYKVAQQFDSGRDLPAPSLDDSVAGEDALTGPQPVATR
jgi:hypothetical protein